MGGDLIVERREREFCPSVQAHPGQYGSGRAGRQGTRGPGHGIRQMITLNLELHGTASWGGSWGKQSGFVGGHRPSVGPPPGTEDMVGRVLAHRAYCGLFFSY